MSFEQIKGTGVAIVTPFNSDKSIDFQSLENLIEYQIENGVDFVVVLGTTGEAVTLSAQEKDQLIDFVIQKVAGRIPVVAGYGGNHTDKIVEAIKRRNFKGITAILSVTPYYNKPSQEGLFEHYAAIAEVSPVPIIMYNVPPRTAVNLEASTVLRLANRYPNIRAVKEASGNFAQMMEIMQHKPANFLLLSGDDAITLPMLSIGASGVISVTANYKTAEFSTMVRYALEGDFQKAQQIHYQLLPVIESVFADGNPSGIKALLHHKGLVKNEFRLPVTPVNNQVFETLKQFV